MPTDRNTEIDLDMELMREHYEKIVDALKTLMPTINYYFKQTMGTTRKQRNAIELLNAVVKGNRDK